jgi:hypothetical protein
MIARLYWASKGCAIAHRGRIHRRAKRLRACARRSRLCVGSAILAKQIGDAGMKVEIGGHAFIRPRGGIPHSLEGFGDTSALVVIRS